MATNHLTTLTPAQISPFFARCCDAVIPHIPEGLDEGELEQTVEEIYHQHTVTLPWGEISQAEAYTLLRALDAARDCGALLPVEREVSMQFHFSLEDVMGRENSGGFHRRCDALARLKWFAAELANGDSPCENMIAALNQGIRSFDFITDHTSTYQMHQPIHYGGPTVGEVEAVEKAFAKVGLSVEQAHDAVGYHPKTEAAE